MVAPRFIAAVADVHIEGRVFRAIFPLWARTRAGAVVKIRRAMAARQGTTVAVSLRGIMPMDKVEAGRYEFDGGWAYGPSFMPVYTVLEDGRILDRVAA